MDLCQEFIARSLTFSPLKIHPSHGATSTKMGGLISAPLGRTQQNNRCVRDTLHGLTYNHCICKMLVFETILTGLSNAVFEPPQSSILDGHHTIPTPMFSSKHYVHAKVLHNFIHRCSVAHRYVALQRKQPGRGQVDSWTKRSSRSFPALIIL